MAGSTPVFGTAARRLGLGTVQFGFDYGVTNRRGKVDETEARAILSLARNAGMRVLDTANQYGDSQRVLGSLSDITHSFRIITKTPALGPDQIDAAQISAVREAIDLSCRLLRRERLDGLLVHNADALLRPGALELWAMLSEARESGKIERIGLSTDDPDLLRALLERFDPDLVQLPLNILDQRFAASGLLQTLCVRGIEVHVRSVFLQGILLSDSWEMPPPVRHLRSAVAAFHHFADAHGLTPVAACLGYALSHAEVGCVLVGVTSVDELEAVLAATLDLPDRVPDVEKLAVTDPDLIKPGRWRVPAIPWGSAP